MGRYGWWWRLHWRAFRLYWPEGPARIVLRESADQSWEPVQFTYGETPAVSFVHMLRAVEVPEGAIVVDLGCGRGLHLLAAARLLGVRVRAVDLMAPFIEKGSQLVRELGLERQVAFSHRDLLDAEIGDAQVVHVVTTTFLPEFKTRLEAHLAAHMAPGAWLLTHAWRPRSARFRLMATRDYPVTWGWSTIYFHQVTEPEAPPASPAGLEEDPPGASQAADSGS